MSKLFFRALRVSVAGAAALLAARMGTACTGREPSSSRPTGIASIEVDALDGQRAFDEVAALVALGPRDAGTPGAQRAAQHLRDRLHAIGVEAVVDSFGDATPIGPLTFHNVIGRLPGRGRGLILLGSHFDTKAGMGPAFEGANDSGSSTGLLLELARVLSAHPAFDPEILFVFFDGEECMQEYGPNDGLHGSRHMAAHLVSSGRAADVKAVIILDMVGDRDLTITLPRNATPSLLADVFAAASEEGVRDRFRLFPGAIIDDHVPFLEAAMPTVNMIDFEFGSAPGLNDYWHTDEDRLDKISAESLETVGRVTLRLLQRMLMR